jgi:hypothetical protein
MSTYDAIRNAARAFEREFVRSDPATPAPSTLATLAQDLTALIGSLPGATSGNATGATGEPAQIGKLGQRTTSCPELCLFCRRGCSAHRRRRGRRRGYRSAEGRRRSPDHYRVTAGISVQVRTRSSNASLSRSFSGPA